MTEGQLSKEVERVLADEWSLEWMGEHLTELKQEASGERLLYSSLIGGLVVGLIAHVGGYLLLESAPGGLLGLLADLLHALGWSLWTGVVVAVFVQVIPDVKRRQIREAVEAYERLRRKKDAKGRTSNVDPAAGGRTSKNRRGKKRN